MALDAICSRDATSSPALSPPLPVLAPVALKPYGGDNPGGCVVPPGGALQSSNLVPVSHPSHHPPPPPPHAPSPHHPSLGPPQASAAAAAALEQYRLQLYNLAIAERLRLASSLAWGASAAAAVGPRPGLVPQSAQQGHQGALSPDVCISAATPFGTLSTPLTTFSHLGPHPTPYSHPLYPYRLDPRLYRVPEEPKPQYSYIGLIAKAILSIPEKKMILSDIYQYILDNYPYFRTRGPGWRNSVRHNLSLNDCFIKAGRSANGKGHYWAIHPANVEDFKKGDFRRRKAQRRVRKHMGLAVEDDSSQSPTPPSPPPSPSMLPGGGAGGGGAITGSLGELNRSPMTTTAFSSSAPKILPFFDSQPVSRKRQFDMASLLAPDHHHHQHQHHHHHHHHHHQFPDVAPGGDKLPPATTEDTEIDVVTDESCEVGATSPLSLKEEPRGTAFGSEVLGHHIKKEPQQEPSQRASPVISPKEEAPLSPHPPVASLSNADEEEDEEEDDEEDVDRSGSPWPLLGWTRVMGGGGVTSWPIVLSSPLHSQTASPKAALN